MRPLQPLLLLLLLRRRRSPLALACMSASRAESSGLSGRAVLSASARSLALAIFLRTGQVRYRTDGLCSLCQRLAQVTRCCTASAQAARLRAGRSEY